MNEYFNEEKFKYIPYPFTNYSLEEFGDYDTTCCWFGGIHGQDHINAIETISQRPYKLRNEAFSHFNRKIMPQFKVRTNEIATCKSLILAYKDPWNLIDDFYTEGEDFIYFEDFKQLEEILEDVENNFDNYKNIINNAYEKVKNYSVESILEYIKNDDPNLITWSLKNVQ